MVANIIKELGVYIGEDFLGGKNPFNPKGHFENRDFVEMNVKILGATGGKWSIPPSREEILAWKDEVAPQIKELIAKHEKEVWGWKDPRNTITLELYLPHLKNPHLLICYRDTDDIVASLQNREREIFDKDIPKGWAVNLVSTYNGRIAETIADYPDTPKMNIRYDDVVTHPKENIRKMVEFLEITPKQEQVENAMHVIMTPEEKAKAKEELWKVASKTQT